MSIKNTVGWPLKFSRQSLKTINFYVTTLKAYFSDRITKTITPREPAISPLKLINRPPKTDRYKGTTQTKSLIKQVISRDAKVPT